MNLREQWRAWSAIPAVRTTLFVIGCLLMLLSPLVGVLPGPGFIVMFPLGLALALKNSQWAKRRYVRFKQWQPKAGGWADWGLRRPSALRREALRKEQEEARAIPDD